MVMLACFVLALLAPLAWAALIAKSGVEVRSCQGKIVYPRKTFDRIRKK